MQAQIEHTYDASTRSRNPLRFLLQIPFYPALMLNHGGLIRNFFTRELGSRFRGSALGSLWVLVHPMFLFATYYVVFGVMFGMRDKEGFPENWYAFYLITGVLAWTLFAETTMYCTSVIIANGNLIKKVKFPAQLLPIPISAVNSMVFLVGVGAYLGFALVSGYEWCPGWSLLWLPVVMFVQLLFTIGVSFLLAAGNVFLRDLTQIYPIIANLWFFTTPVFWYPRMFGKSATLKALAPLLELNPMYHIIGAQRSALGTAMDPKLGVLPQLGAAAVPAVITFAVGFCFFRSLQHRFADEV